MPNHLLALLCLLLGGTALHAQITLTDAYFPVVGDSLQYGIADSTITVDLQEAAPNQNWDFGTLEARATRTLVARAVATNDTTFTEADLTLDIDANTLGYFRSEAGTFSLVGIRGELPFLPGFEYTTEVDPARIDRRAPLAYEDVYTSTTQNTILVPSDSIPDEALEEFNINPTLVDSLRITSTSERRDEVDAYGTLTLNDETYSVLRERRSETIVSKIEVKLGSLGWQDVTAAIAAALPDFEVFFGNGEPTDTYYFWAADTKEAIAIVSYDEEDEFAGMTFILDDQTSSLEGPRLGQAQVQLFPNPARTSATLQLSGLDAGDYTLSIINVLGRRVGQQTFPALGGRASVELDVSQLPRGPYLYSVTNARGRILTTRRLLVTTD